jgi:hypothetical protein
MTIKEIAEHVVEWNRLIPEQIQELVAELTILRKKVL